MKTIEQQTTKENIIISIDPTLEIKVGDLTFDTNDEDMNIILKKYQKKSYQDDGLSMGLEHIVDVYCLEDKVIYKNIEAYRFKVMVDEK